MNERIKTSLFDVIQACDNVVAHLLHVASLTEYKATRLVQAAVERELSIIGEALARIRKAGGEGLLISAPAVIQFRNLLIHNYERIDDSTVYNIAQRHVPMLRAEAYRLLDENGGIPVFISES